MGSPVRGDQGAHTPPCDPFLGEDGCGQQGFRGRARTAPSSWFRSNAGEAERLLSEQPAGVRGAEQPHSLSPPRTGAPDPWMPRIPEREEPPGGAVQDADTEGVGVTKDAQPGGGAELCTALWEKKMPMWSVATLVLIGVSVIVSVLGKKYATTMAPCPEDGWIWSKGKCYYFSQDTTDWKSSQEFCSSKRSSLAILNDPVVLKTIFRFKDSSQDYWIGLKKITVTGHQEWQWVDGSSFENEVELSQSDGPALDCVCLNSKKAWNLDCASQRPWICIKEAS
ncbi:hypothetical protein NDU88_000664 [Pleurodeles waltl]|uniref:C-type lectin domain-containing protein n=1 Tax=Pleurodeles waltl TaxID=8319 RepID=A0AAV7P1J6_PLEWA|nr:hypothetical protein NDU88_000664 [Pleurodeles waltl]